VVSLQFRRRAGRYARNCLSLLLLLVIAGGCQGISSRFGSFSKRPPSMVILLADDAGYSDFGFTGLSQIKTPNIDRIASQGVVCAQGYVCASVCSPSRAGMLTGRYPQRFGHEMNLPAGSGLGLALTERTIADRLKRLGYATGAVGKWHLGEEPPYRPRQRGFDSFQGFLGGSRTYHDRASLARRTVWLDGDAPSPLPAPYVTDAIGMAASRFIREHSDEPFFLYVAFNAVHTPMQALDADLEQVSPDIQNKRRQLLAMTIALDRAVGKVLQTIDDEGLGEDTIVMFLNDNGGATNNASDNGPLRGMKGSKFEGGIRVPWAVRWPGKIPAGTRHPHPISTLDIAATLLAAAGADADSHQDLDGVDISRHLAGSDSDPPHDALFWRRSVAAAVRRGPWKLIRVEGLSPQLFHLQDDPGEQNDVSLDHAEVVSDLSARLKEWELQLTEPSWQTGEIWRKNQVEKHRPGFFGREKERSRP